MLFSETLVQPGEATGGLAQPRAAVASVSAATALPIMPAPNRTTEAGGVTVSSHGGGSSPGVLAPAPPPIESRTEVSRQQQSRDHAQARPGAYSSVDAAVVMSLLPHERWGFHYIQDEDNGEGDGECRVCLVDYEPDDEIVRLPCMHYAHTRCVEQWLVRRPICPVCRTNVREALQAS